MKLPEFGVFSTETLLLHSLATGEDGTRFLKRAAILFEKLLLVPLELFPVDIRLQVHHLFTKEYYLSWLSPEDPPLRKEFLSLFLLVTDLVSDPKEFYEKLHQPSSDDLVGGEQTEKYLSWFLKAYRQLTHSEDPYAIESIPENLVHQIAIDCKLFKIINRDFDCCSGLFSEYHEVAILATLSTKVKNPYEVATIVSDLNTFDFANLSWRDIFALRKNGFVDEFRSKIAEWVVERSSAADSESFVDKLNSFIEEAKFRLIGDTAPALRKTVLAGIGGNLLSPFGINPISVYSAIEAVKREHDLKKKFGWLYFIERARRWAKPHSGIQNRNIHE